MCDNIAHNHNIISSHGSAITQSELKRKTKRHKVTLPNPPEGHSHLCKIAKMQLAWEDMHVREDGQRSTFNVDDWTSEEIKLAGWQACALQNWCRLGKRCCFIDAPTFVELMETECVDHVSPNDIIEPYPSFLLSLPEKYAKLYFSSPSGDAWMSHLYVNVFDNMFPADVNFQGRDHTICFGSGERTLMVSGVWKGAQAGVFQTLCLPLDGDETIRTVFARYDDEWIPTTLSDSLSDEERMHDMSISMKMAEFTANLLLFMQSYPQYIDKVKKNIRAGRKKDKVPSESLIITAPSHMKLRSAVSLDPTDALSESTHSTGKTMQTHWRRSFWRRQVHGNLWEIENPDAKCGTFPDGRRYHLKMIQRTQINSPFDNETLDTS